MSTRIVSSRSKPRRAKALTAAAKRIDITTKAGRDLIRSPENWQTEAWAFFRAVPGITFAGGFMGNALSRVRPYPAVVIDPDEPPVALTDAAALGESGITEEFAAAANDEFARLGNSRDGVPGIMRNLGICIAISGEGYLIGRPSDEDDGMAEERWGVYSSSAIEAKGQGRSSKVFVKERKSGKGEELPPESFVARIWRCDPEWPGDPWCNMVSILGEAEELVIYGRVFRAIAKSGANGGILTMPTELDLEAATRVSNDDDTPGDDLTQLQRDYLEFVTQTIERDDTAGAAAPFVLDGAAAFLEAVRWINTTRTLDPRALERIEALKEELAHGLDLPIEVIKGVGDLNHWTGWLISDDTYKAHVEPTGQVIAQGLASAFLRPWLLDLRYDPEVVRRVVVGLDPAALVVRPNRGQDARDAYDRREISGEALRRYLGMTDTDAPEDDELLRRYALERGIGGQDLTAVLMNRTVTADDPIPMPSEIAAENRDPTGEGADGTPADPELPAEEGGDPLPGTQPARALPAPRGLPARALTAASEPDDDDPWELLALLLAGIETHLMARLSVAASDDVNEALRVAGSRLRSAAQGNAEARDRIRGVAPEDVPRALGADLAAELADESRLLDGALGTLRERWDAWVADSQAQVASTLERATAAAPDPAAAQEALDAYRGRAEGDREAGWVVLAGLLLATIRERLWSDAAEIVQGEYDPTVSVPAGVLRDALARVGGGQPGLAPAGSAQHSAPGGLTTGPHIRNLLSALGAVVLAWRWDAGRPAHPFEPHQALDGVTFDRWDDPRLANGGTWPGTPFLHPGDHRGCVCSATPVVVSMNRQRQEVA